MRRVLVSLVLGGLALAAASSVPATANGLGTVAARGFALRLSGAQEVPPPADADGSGQVGLSVDPQRGRVCVGIQVTNVAPLTLAHIHNAPAGQNGPVKVDFTPLIRTGSSVAGCVSGLDPTLLANIVNHPDQYYVNVHNTVYPGGAVRGQLA